MKGETLIVWLPIVDPQKRGKIWAVMIQDPWTSSSKGACKGLTPNGVGKTFFMILLAWKHWHKSPLEVPELKWTLDDTSDLLSFFTRSARSASLSFFTRSARSDSLTLFTRGAWWFSLSSQEMPNLYYAFIFMLGFPRTLGQNLLPTDSQGENLFFYVSADCIQEKFSREGERQLQQVSDILRQMQGETATSSSCLFMLSLLNLHMLAGLYLQSL